MKAVFIKEFGGPENLEIREVADPPKPVSTQVLVRVKAAGLNRADIIQRKGFYPAPSGYKTEIPGLEFAGEIVEFGEDVGGCHVGDRVMGITAGEAQAEYLIADASTLIPIPSGLSFTEAAAIPEAFITAHDAVFTQARAADGETLLIHAVASGVGVAALQMGEVKGLKIIGTSRTAAKLERCAEFGLDHGISSSEFSGSVMEFTGGKGANVILDLVGASYFKENLASLATQGRMVLVGLIGGAVAEFDMRQALYKRATIIGTVLRARTTFEKAEASGSFARDILPYFESGMIKPNLDKVFAASDVRAAHEYLESNEGFGKAVLEF